MRTPLFYCIIFISTTLSLIMHNLVLFFIICIAYIQNLLPLKYKKSKFIYIEYFFIHSCESIMTIQFSRKILLYLKRAYSIFYKYYFFFLFKTGKFDQSVVYVTGVAWGGGSYRHCYGFRKHLQILSLCEPDKQRIRRHVDRGLPHTLYTWLYKIYFKALHRSLQILWKRV